MSGPSVGELPEDLAALIVERLRAQGITIPALEECVGCEGETPVKVVAVAANVGRALETLSQTKRDQVVMVRVDADTADKLDAWVKTGAVRSRSEAAALFIREGLQVRAQELGSLQEALDDLERAQDRLRERVEEMLGLEGREEEEAT